MNWNPFTRNANSRKSVGLITTRDFDRETRRLECLEDNAKSLTRDILKQNKAFDEFSKGQLKLINDLASSAFINHYEQHQDQQTQSILSSQQLMTNWKQTSQKIYEQTNLMNEMTAKTIIESSKRLTIALNNVIHSIKKREQSLNDYLKIQNKLDKLNEKKLTTNKLEQIQKQLTDAKQQYELRNSLLTQELPILHERRAAFVYPCLEAFIEAQVHYCEQLENAYNGLVNIIDVDSNNDSTLDEINTKLAGIKALSIVASE
ncbi:unnamed protein product [Didymodactylos carnosus]|uniref:BAR domain-containing protein n=1 Tax=Didymodactylos carnosus TaxID=1234261 RepID=A0A813QTX8_9BILA|nr:unnamed protein product [Didymodactylos carnosus]CAF1277934.1 unnamed protein product [Didymodactylos carnosus]CAF3554589.1 unnamed protein product [Didymodactylos carnosus]CAF4082882.1 unnamed protein product [Didymodactylos carnosus]